MQRIGVLGASFNPPTLGHQNVIAQSLDFFDKILLVPSIAHPFLKVLAPIHHRLNMLQLLMPQENKLEISLIEQSLDTGGPIYTYDVLTALSKAYQGQLYFIMGQDLAKVWHKFYRWQDIEKKWPLFIAKEILPIHSTMVREYIKNHAHSPTLLEELTKFTGKAIAEYIIKENLYVT